MRALYVALARTTLPAHDVAWAQHDCSGERMNSSVDSDGAELRVICGPTAAGKSALAMQSPSARLSILSADSRQIYRGFDVGTAKPSQADRARVPHFGIDVADPAERWSAARFADEARNVHPNTGVPEHSLLEAPGSIFARSPRRSTRRPISIPRAAQTSAPELAQVETGELRRWVQRSIRRGRTSDVRSCSAPRKSRCSPVAV